MHSQPDSAYRQRERSTQGPTGVQREGTADARPYSNVSRTWQDPEINSIEDGRLMKPCELCMVMQHKIYFNIDDARPDQT